MKYVFKADSIIGVGVPARQLAAEIATLPLPYSVGPVLEPAEAICGPRKSLKNLLISS